MERLKISFLFLLIVFALGLFFYLLDSWQILNIENYLPGLSEEAPLVGKDLDTPTELEWQELKKEREKLEERELKFTEELKQLKEEQETLSGREGNLKHKIAGFNKEQERFKKLQEAYQDRKKNVKAMAERLQAMPPNEIIEIIENWTNRDLIQVFLEMEKNAQEAGETSIVPYLLTLLPKERSALLTTLMLDENVAK